MRKIFLFLFAAVLSIGTAMAANLDCAGATATLEGQNLVLQGDADTGEKLTVMLWQGSDGAATGNYPIGDFDIILDNVTWLTAETAGVYTVMGNMFTFEATANDGSTQYSIYMMGSTESSTPETNEMEAKNYVNFTCDADGAWTIEAYADDDSWNLNLELAMDLMTGEYSAYGTYVTDMETWATEEVYGTGQLYYDDFTGRMVFKATSMIAESGEIYPILYASQLNLETNDFMTGESWIGQVFGGNYHEVTFSAADYSWELDLHASNCTGANGEYDIEVVDEAEGAYSTFNYYKVLGKLTIEDGAYNAEVYTLDMGGNPAMDISCFAQQVELTEYTININNATVIEDLSQYGSSWSMKGEVEIEGTTYPVSVEIADDVDLTVPSADVYLSVTVEGFGFVDGDATLTINGNTMAVAGILENAPAGVKFVFNISGTLPTCANIRLQTGSNAGILAAADGKQVNVTVARNFVANDGYYTLCVPFNMPANVIGKAYQIDEVLGNVAEGLEVTFTEVTTILAGQPYLIEPATNLDGFTVENVTINNSTPAAVTVSGAGVSITMQGTYSRDEQTNGLYWVGNGGYLYNENKWKNALCAYFDITTPSGVAPRMRVVANENAETGVDNINGANDIVKMIENGQLIIVIDGVKYNAQGVRF